MGRPLKNPPPAPKKAPVRTTRPDTYTTAQIARAAGRGDKFKDTYWHHIFLDALRQKPNVSAACKKARVSRPNVYWHREQYTDFAEAWDDALEEGRDLVEEMMFDAATEGDYKSREFLLQKWRYSQKKQAPKSDEQPKVVVQWGAPR